MYKPIVLLWFIVLYTSAIHGQEPPAGFMHSYSINEDLSAPVRMAFDNMDNIYVTDAIQKVIKKYDAAGNYLESIITGGSPISIAINESNQLFFGDGVTGKILKVNSNGAIQELYTGTVFPSSMVFCSDGLLYVVDSELKQVIVLDLSGNVVRIIGSGILTYPAGITFDRKNNRILVTEHGGIGTGYNPVIKVRIFGLTGNLITSFGSHGNTDGKFYRLQGIAVGRCGEIYVPDPFQGNVSVFNETGVFSTRFGQYGDSLSQLRVPLDIAISSQDKIFITSENNGALEVYNLDYILPTSDINCGNKSICAGTTTDIPVHFTGTAPWTFTYTINDLNPTTIDSTYDNPYIITTSTEGTYRVAALSDSLHIGVCFSGSSVVTVSSVLPTCSIMDGNISFCTGQTSDIHIEFTGVTPWTFTYTTNGTNPKTISDVAISPYNLNVSEPGNYLITEVTSHGCTGSVMNGDASVIERALPSAGMISGTIITCAGDTAKLPIDFTGTAPWSFTYTINDLNPTTILNITDNPFLFHAAIAGKYKITGLQDAFCVSEVSSGSPEVVIKELPTASISSGNASFCSGDSTLITIDFTGSAPWAFTYTIDAQNPLAISGITDNPYTRFVTIPGIYKLVSVSDSFCTGVASTTSVTITENPLPVFSLGPSVEICEGQLYTIDAGPSFAHYLWSDGSEGQTLDVSMAGIYSVTVTDFNGCRAAATKVITSTPLPTGTITSGDTTICSGETVDLNIILTGVPPWSLTYTLNESNPVAINNITTSPYILNVYKNGSYRITEVSDAQCPNSIPSANTVVSVHPLPKYNFSSGNVTMCSGGTTNLIIGLTGTAPWTFTYTVNGLDPVTITGATENPYTLTVSRGGTYEIIALKDAICTGTGNNGNVTVTEKALPIVYLGPDATICNGEVLKLDASPSFAAFFWNDGSTAQTLDVTSAGNYYVTVTDFEGCMNSDTIFVSISGTIKILNLASVMPEGLYEGQGILRPVSGENGSQFGDLIADQVTVELHPVPYTDTPAYAATGYLSTNGNLVIPGIPCAIEGQYYITLRHRNSIATVSASPVAFTQEIINYAFDLPSKVLGGNLKFMEDGGYAIFSGDVNQDGHIDETDLNIVNDLSSSFGYDYIPEDINGDGLVDIADLMIVDNNASRNVTSVIP